MAVNSTGDSRPIARVRLIDAADFSTSWMEEVDLATAGGSSSLNMACVVDADGPSVYFCVRTRPVGEERERLVLCRRDLKGRTIVGAIGEGLLPDYGQTFCPRFDAEGALEGLVVANIHRYSAALARGTFGGSRVDWIALPGGASNELRVEVETTAALGLALIPTSAHHGRFFSGVALATRRSKDGGGRVMVLGKSSVSAELDLPAPHHPTDKGFWGTSMCWIRDVDADGLADLAIGCTATVGGEILIVGSKNGNQIARVIPDAEGDGEEDLVASAVSPQGCMHYEAALSIVSPRTWKVTRLLYEKDLAGARSSK